MFSTLSFASSQVAESDHKAWLKQQFSEQHEALIPIVAVADIFWSCNQSRKIDSHNYPLSYLITKMDKVELSAKLTKCLAGDNLRSAVAIDFGLKSCFTAQFSHLSATEQEAKMALVTKALVSLPLTEKQKSFTDCVTMQAIHYLK